MKIWNTLEANLASHCSTSPFSAESLLQVKPSFDEPPCECFFFELFVRDDLDSVCFSLLESVLSAAFEDVELFFLFFESPISKDQWDNRRVIRDYEK